jgi:mRNA-degrading endonuclease YafQ of YafQ-DinJ toxin-antitoxin module
MISGDSARSWTTEVGSRLQFVVSTAFKKLLKGQKHLESIFWTKVELFIEDPFDPRLKTHKLSGQLKDLWSFSIAYDVRVVFFFEDQKATFVDIGDHDTVY